MVSGGFRLDLLLETAHLARSTYYYHLKQLDKPEKNQGLKAEIQSIYSEHKGNYGYRRVTLELRNRGFVVNHKKVQRLMKVLGLAARIRRKRKYSFYQGEIGKKADNLIQRQFEASKPMEKCYTDVTEFAIPASRQKLYLSPVLDGYMSRKGNSPDNGMMESFFGILKSEMFYGYEKHFRSLEDLEQAIVDYIDYYNNKRIKVKLKGLSPVQYRTKSSG
ncbi:hypothetical protein D8875_10200 [Streptococcus sanguinis]|nr:hypothetical protein D8875_10200 [Streptococcus sanguinis]